MTEYSEHLSVIMSENGRRSYFFKAPLLEGYTLVKEPYREFRKGIEITTYQDDSLTTVDAVLTANYAIYYENRKLWEAKGDVVVVKSDGKTLYTQQLFWNAKAQRIYSNVDTKIVQNEGGNVFQGEGFESDEAFKEWRFRRFTGKMDVDVSQEDDEPSESEAADGEDRPAGEKTPQSATRPPAGSAPAPAGPTAEQEAAAYAVLVDHQARVNAYLTRLNNAVAAFNNDCMSTSRPLRQSDYNECAAIDSQTLTDFLLLRNSDAFADGSRWLEQKGNLQRAYIALDQYLSVIYDAWGLNLAYENPAEGVDRWMEPVRADQDASGNSIAAAHLNETLASIRL